MIKCPVYPYWWSFFTGSVIANAFLSSQGQIFLAVYADISRAVYLLVILPDQTKNHWLRCCMLVLQISWLLLDALHSTFTYCFLWRGVSLQKFRFTNHHQFLWWISRQFQSIYRRVKCNSAWIVDKCAKLFVMVDGYLYKSRVGWLQLQLLQKYVVSYNYCYF